MCCGFWGWESMNERSETRSIKLQNKLIVLTLWQSNALRTCPTLFSLSRIFFFSFFFTPLLFIRQKRIEKQSAAALPQSVRHSEGELTQFRSLGCQTANKTAVTCAPLAGCNSFQTHRKEALQVSHWLEWGGMVTVACSPPVSQGQRLPHSHGCMCVCVLWV